MSNLDDYREKPSMAQQITNKEGYKELVQYIGNEEVAKKLARLNVLIKLGYVRETKVITLAKLVLIEENKAYFVSKEATEVTHLGLILGDIRKRGSGRKRM